MRASQAQTLRDLSVAPEPFANDVVRGLSAARKRIPAKYFYDEAGSVLFEAITRQPEYYPTNAEIAILDARGADLAALVPPDAVLVEFGSGSTVKIRRLLAAMPTLRTYVPVDISATFLQEEAIRLRRDVPGLEVLPVAADFTRGFALPATIAGRPRVGFFPGSTIGNFEPLEALAFLRHARGILGAGAILVVGADLVKDPWVLHRAYNDAAGVTAAFNLNLLVRINRELGGDFDVDAFEHRAFFEPAASRIEMHLASRRAQTVSVLGHTFSFRPDETIHTENSYKHTVAGFRRMAEEAGWTPAAAWLDERELFSLHVLRS